MRLTLPIGEVLPATARARIVRVDLQGHEFPYEPGQALSLATHGTEPRRPYSIASAPDEAARTGCLELLVGVGVDGQPGPHLQLSPGTLVDIEGPLGRFAFSAEADVTRLLFVAGGTGIAPLRSMLRHALALGFQHIGVLYSARTPDDFAYEAELRDLAAQGRIELLLTVTREVDASWNGTRGRIGSELLRALIHDPATLCFICGPRTLVDEVPRVLANLGVRPDRIRIEEW